MLDELDNNDFACMHFYIKSKLLAMSLMLFDLQDSYLEFKCFMLATLKKRRPKHLQMGQRKRMSKMVVQEYSLDILMEPAKQNLKLLANNQTTSELKHALY